MGWVGDSWDWTKKQASKLPSVQILNRAGEATGIIKPTDKIDEQGAMAGASESSDEVLRRALEQQSLLNGGVQAGADITKFAGSYVGPAAITPERIEGVLPQQQVMADYKQRNPIIPTVMKTADPSMNVQMQPTATSFDAANLGQAEQSSFSNGQRATIDPLANSLRGEQLDAARAIATAPSVADAKMRAGMAATAEEQLGIVAGARGSERAGLRAEAARQMAAKGVQASALGAAASAQEEVAKRAAFAQALLGARGQDASLATDQAQLDAQMNSLDAQIKARTAEGNTKAVNDLKVQQGLLTQDARAKGMTAGLDYVKAAADVETASANRATQNSQFNTTQTNTGTVLDANAVRDANKDDVTNFGNTSQVNAAAGNTIGRDNINRDVGIKSTNAANNLTGQTQTSTNDLAAQNTRLSGMTSGANVSTNAGQAGTSALGVGATAAGIKADIGRAIIAGETVQQNAEQAANERLVKFGATAASVAGGSPAGAGSTSDERAKKDVRRISDDDLIRFGESLKNASFEYKPGFGEDTQERHAGVPSANELEKDPVGKLFVSKDENGVRHVAYPQMDIALTSAMLRRQKAGAR
jgi:hypothetical protein